MDRTKQRFSPTTLYRPDFVNAFPKSGDTLGLVTKCLDCKMFLSQEESLRKAAAILWHLYSNCCNGFCRIKHMINTHRNLVKANKSLQFLVYFADDEAGAYMCLNPSFCKVKHGVHFQCPF